MFGQRRGVVGHGPSGNARGGASCGRIGHAHVEVGTSPSVPGRLANDRHGAVVHHHRLHIELTVGDVSPGGRFDPLGLAESGDLEELKIKELKHCRLSMFAWLGCIMQGLATQEGPIANWQAHVADPVHANVLTNAASGFGFY